MTFIPIGAFLGFLAGGPVGALFGALIGLLISRQIIDNPIPEFGTSRSQRQLVQSVFFKASFLVMGRISKADGRVNEREIEMAREVMDNLKLSDRLRREAISLFNEGKNPASDIESVLHAFRRVKGSSTLIPMFLEIQLSAAYADGGLGEAEREVFRHVCVHLGVSSAVFDKIHRRFCAQRDYFQGKSKFQGSGRSFSEPSLSRAYEVLGVESTDSDKDVKKAYRKLMSEHHPDKLVAKGLPEEMMAVAKERTQEIQGAYDRIRNHRKSS